MTNFEFTPFTYVIELRLILWSSHTRENGKVENINSDELKYKLYMFLLFFVWTQNFSFSDVVMCLGRSALNVGLRMVIINVHNAMPKLEGVICELFMQRNWPPLTPPI